MSGCNELRAAGVVLATRLLFLTSCCLSRFLRSRTLRRGAAQRATPLQQFCLQCACVVLPASALSLLVRDRLVCFLFVLKFCLFVCLSCVCVRYTHRCSTDGGIASAIEWSSTPPPRPRLDTFVAHRRVRGLHVCAQFHVRCLRFVPGPQFHCIYFGTRWSFGSNWFCKHRVTNAIAAAGTATFCNL